MITINSKTLEDAIYELCKKANTCYSKELYSLLKEKYVNCTDTQEKLKLSNILKNIKLSAETQRPLCQDTGQVVIFIEIGQNIKIEGEFVNTAINNAAEKAYLDFYYRKSVVKNTLFDRNNTNTNTPCIIYTDIIKDDCINIKLLIKGAGSENYSAIKNFTPNVQFTEIYEFIRQTIVNAGEKSCPPYVISIGAGGTIDYAAIMSKKAFFKTSNSSDENIFINQLKKYLGNINEKILDIKMMSSSTHIASLPIAITINCHSTRHAQCTLNSKGIESENFTYEYQNIDESTINLLEINTTEIEKIRNLPKGTNILLTGEIYTARDAAHKKLVEDYKNYKKTPLDLKNKIIFYAGPCPATQTEVIGPIGATTSTRMDEYTEFMIQKGVIGFIGKGERNSDISKLIQTENVKYFTSQGGIACLLSNCVKKSEIIAYEELGTEAIRKLYVEKFPITVEI